MGPNETMHLISSMSMLGYKITLLIVGYLIVWLGYDLLRKGITGHFTFKGDFLGIKSDLVSASPGLLFTLLGVILLCFAVFEDNKVTSKIKEGQFDVHMQQGPDQEQMMKPQLPSGTQLNKGTE